VEELAAADILEVLHLRVGMRQHLLVLAVAAVLVILVQALVTRAVTVQTASRGSSISTRP
jgi:hypothetical protein